MSLAVLLAAAAVLAASPAPGPAPVVVAVPGFHDPSRVPQDQQVLCTGQWKFADHGREILRANLWGNGRLCIRNQDDGPNFKIIRATERYRRYGGRVSAYPSLYTGCWYSVCSQGTVLPARVSRIRRLTETLVTRYKTGHGQVTNDSDDFWFNREKRTGGAPDGTELMVWLGASRVGSAPIATVWLSGVRWLVSSWITGDGGKPWRYVQFRAARRTQDLRRLNVLPLMRYAIRHGWLRESWYCQALAEGNELWQGGRGDRTLAYRVSVAARRAS